MKMLRYFPVIVSVSLLWVQTASTAVLTHSPMLGAVTDTTIKVWVRADSQVSASVQYQLSGGNWSQPLTSGSVSLVSQNDFTGVISITGLSASRLYDYRVLLNGVVQAGSTADFQTLPPKGSGARFSFVFGADIDQHFKPHTIFDKMALHQPDFAILLGDLIYADLQTGTEADFWAVYKDNRDAAMQAFASQVPIFATWDDHDYGDNDEDKYYPLKTQSRAAFGKYWPNPPYVEQNASIYYKFSAANTDFFMLDDRWNRDPGVTMLGATQLQWLKNQLLASTAKFKFIISAVEVSDFGTTGNDSWIGFPQEREEIFQFIAQNNIKNVIFLTGDQHWAGVFLIDYPVHQIGHNIQGFYEFLPTPLSAFIFPAPTTTDPQVLFTDDGDFYYGLIRVDTTVTPAKIALEIHRDSDDGIVYSLTVEEFTSPSLTIQTSALPDANLGSAYSQTLQADGGVPPYNWRLASGALPSGLALSPSGIISGTPTAQGTFSFTVEVDDSASSTTTRPLSIVVNSAPLIDEHFSGGLNGWVAVDEGTTDGPSAWAIANGVLVQSSNIYGGSTDGADPVKPGTYLATGDAGWTDYELQVQLLSQDDDGIGVMFRYQDGQNYYRFAMDRQRAYRRLTKTVGGVTTTLAEDAVAYQMNRWYGVRIRVEGSRIRVYLDGVLLFDVTDGALAAGKIALYCWGNAGSQFDDVKVVPLSFFIATSSLPDGDKGVAYSQTLEAVGGVPPYSWSLASGTLPAGLSLSSSGGISGTPTTAGEFDFSVRAVDQQAQSKTRALSITIHPQSLFREEFDTDLSRWTVVDEGTNSRPSAWAIASGVLVQSSNIWGGTLDGADPVKPGTYVHAGNISWTDYDFLVSLKSTDDDIIGVMFRYQDGQNYYRFYMDQQGGYRRLTKTVGGTVTILAQDTIQYVTGQWYALNISVIGNRIFVELDGTLLFDVVDSSIPSGKIALYCWANQNCNFDHVLVDPPAPRITTVSLPGGAVGTPYSQTLTAAGGNGPYSWGLIGGTLPSGLSLSLSGTISGTPTTVQVSQFTLQVSDSDGAVDTKPLSIAITSAPPPTVATSSLPNGTLGSSYDQTMAASGGTPPYQWSLASGALPPGLTLSTSGRLSGTPTQAGGFDFTVRVQDAAAQSVTRQLSLFIGGTPALDENFSGSINGWVAVDEGTNEGPSSWAVVNGVLVQSSNIYGGSTDGADPVKPGTYFTTGDVGWTDYELQVRMLSQDDDALGVMFRYQDAQNYYRFSMDRQRAYRRLTKTVNGVTTVLAQDAVPYEMNRWYEVRVLVEGSHIRVYLDGVLLFDVTDSALAAGKVALYCWGNPSQFDDVKVFPLALSITQTSLPDGTVGAAYSQTLTASGGLAPYTWSIAAGALPQGLQLSSGGVISGTPAASGSFSFTVRVQDQAQKSASKPFTLVIQGLTLFSDNFSNGLGSWTSVDEGTTDAPSAWAIASGVLVQSSNIWGGSPDGADPVKPGTFLLAGDASWTNYEFSVRLRSTDDDGIGVMFRYRDSQNYYRFSMDQQRSFRRLVKVVNGITTILAQDAVAYTANQWYQVKVVLAAERIQLYVDGGLLFDVVDTSITSGRIALYCWGNPDSNFDDVLVTQK
jgi:phosphodiesterase/alkaline phosphatase D-like protein